MTRPFVVGEGATFVLSGWYRYPGIGVRSVQVRAADATYNSYLIGNYDVIKTRRALAQQPRDPERENFVAFISLAAIAAPRQLPLTLLIMLKNGKNVQVELGSLHLTPQQTAITPLQITGSFSTPNDPFVAICMATYNPPIALFKRQVQSLCEQTHRNWVCIINDDCSAPETYVHMRDVVRGDGRFYLFQNATNMGFYHNFEQALLHVPAKVDFVALSDQDDYWYPTKIRETLAAFQPENTLVYTDMDVVTDTGETLYHTFWVGRANNYTNFEKLLFLNSVTGASAIFRASLLRTLLPFPPPIGKSYHDHWVASAAMAEGTLGYVDKPLYAYIQHSSNVSAQGFMDPSAPVGRGGKLAVLLRKVNTALGRSKNVYFHDTLRFLLFGKVLLLRAKHLTPDKRRKLQGILRKVDFVFRKTQVYQE